MIANRLASLVLMAPVPPPPPSTADRILIGIFILFALYKAIRLMKTTRLGWSFASYNVVLAFLFTLGVYILPFVTWPYSIEAALLTIARTGLVVSIIWCVVEVELSRRDMTLSGNWRRRGGGQQT